METRKTYILKLTDNTSSVTKTFICNRSSSSSEFNTVFNDKYIKFFELEKLDYMDINSSSFEILDTLDLENVNNADQKQINIIKKKYINELVAEEDEIICNKLLNNNITKIKQCYRLHFKNLFSNIINEANNLLYENSFQSIYDEHIKKLWFYKLDYILSTPKWAIKLDNDKDTALAILLKDSFKYLIKCNPYFIQPAQFSWLKLIISSKNLNVYIKNFNLK